MNSFQQEFAKIKAEIPDCGVARMLKNVKADTGGRPLVLYGAGRLAGVILDFCAMEKLPVVAICDRSVGGTCEGIPIITPQTLVAEYADAMVVICSHGFYDEIAADLARRSFQPEQIAPCPFTHPYFESLRSFAPHLDGYAWAFDFYPDEKSKQLVLDRLRLHLLDEPLKPDTHSECYYEAGFITLSSREIFVDGGAFTGDTAQRFIEIVEQTPQVKEYAVYSFEPDPVNYQQAREVLARYGNFEVVPKGLWSAEASLEFYEKSENMAGSSIAYIPNGIDTHQVEVTSIDAFFSQKPDGEQPTFIKMDIEGSEKEALLGASKTLQGTMPKLAICAYHKPEDVYELPQTILGIRDDYRFALRQHGDGAYDTVLYAV